jgi:hypothetical protein
VHYRFADSRMKAAIPMKSPFPHKALFRFREAVSFLILRENRFAPVFVLRCHPEASVVQRAEGSLFV